MDSKPLGKCLERRERKKRGQTRKRPTKIKVLQKVKVARWVATLSQMLRDQTVMAVVKCEIQWRGVQVNISKMSLIQRLEMKMTEWIQRFLQLKKMQVPL